MGEFALVKKLENEYAIVEIERSKSCGSCNACSMNQVGKMEGRASNEIGATVGDVVSIDVRGSMLGLFSVVYLIPLLMFFAGYFVGTQIFGGGEGLGIASAVIFLLFSFIFVIIFDRRSKAKGTYELAVKKIIRRG